MIWTLKVKQMFTSCRRGKEQPESRKLLKHEEFGEYLSWASGPGTGWENKAGTASQKARVCFRLFRFPSAHCTLSKDNRAPSHPGSQCVPGKMFKVSFNLKQMCHQHFYKPPRKKKKKQKLLKCENN